MPKPDALNGSPLRVSRLARVVSALIHVTIGTALVLASASAEGGSSGASSVAGSAPDGVRQLRGDDPKKALGRDRLYEILDADDAVRVRLTSPAGDPVVGLAWWSPSRGMWLAIDLATAYAGQTLQAFEGDGGRSGPPVARVELDSRGSGRVVAAWSSPKSVASTGSVTLTVTARRGVWPFNQTPMVLTGTGQAR